MGNTKKENVNFLKCVIIIDLHARESHTFEAKQSRVSIS